MFRWYRLLDAPSPIHFLSLILFPHASCFSFFQLRQLRRDDRIKMCQVMTNTHSDNYMQKSRTAEFAETEDFRREVT